MRIGKAISFAMTTVLISQVAFGFQSPANAAITIPKRPAITLSNSNQTITIGNQILPVVATNTGGALTSAFTVSPNPASIGLTFTADKTTASISGTPNTFVGSPFTFTISAPYKLLGIIPTTVTSKFKLTVNPIPTVSFVNTIPMINPTTSELMAAGITGDTLNFTMTGLKTPVNAYFGNQTTPVLATTTVVADTYQVVVPAGLTIGNMAVRILDGAGQSRVGIFQLWSSRSEPYVMPAGHLNVSLNDLRIILDNIKMSEAHSARTAALSLSPNTATGTLIYPYDVISTNRCLSADDVLTAATPTFGLTGLSNAYTWTQVDPLGLRQVDGQCNNITAVKAEPGSSASDTALWGAADQQFPRIAPATNTPSTPYALSDAQKAYQVPTNNVIDPTPRIISNLISDQTTANPAAVAAAYEAASIIYSSPSYSTENSINATSGAVTSVLQIPNITADYNVSAGYNSWFTLFGQFYDHGLDLIPKAGASVLIPLQQGDPLYVNSPTAPNFMVLTRGADATGNSMNETTPYVDQSQTYGSHPSQNFFLREYNFDFTGAKTKITSTGRLVEGNDVAFAGKILPPEWDANPTIGGTLNQATGATTDSSNGGLPTWQIIKAQARLLGFNLTDYDVRSIPVIATDQYGKFIPGPTGYPMMLFANGGQYKWQEGSGATPISTTLAGGWVAVASGHTFLNDTTAAAVPFCSDGTRLTPDADSIMNSALAAPARVCGPTATYDDETLNAHYIAGDGRVNENIGLSAIHYTFHSEHNLLVGDISNLLTNDPEVTLDFRNEWNGERLYQAARFVMEMEYQHMVYDEFIRRIAPGLPVFVQYDPTKNPDITAEFASAVYRVGHSMLNETIARSNPGTFYDPNNNQDVSLLTAFTNPAQARLARPAIIVSASYTSPSITYTLQAGEPVPVVGQVVSITNMDVPAFNIKDGVVASISGSTFKISTRYAAGGATATAFTAPSPTTSASKKACSDPTLVATCTTNYATVTISDPGTAGYTYTPGSSAAAIAQGMSSQRGNEIDEFVTDAVRNNLLGLPLDLASLNITRGRDTGLPTFNQFRSQTASLPAYKSWSDYLLNLRHPESISNFIAAYGTHDSLKSVNVATVTSATVNAAAHSITYATTNTAGILIGDIVSVTGFSTYNAANAIVDSIVPNTSFTVSTQYSSPTNAVLGYAATDATFGSSLRPVAITVVAGSAQSATPTAPNVTRVPTISEQRALGIAISTAAVNVSLTGAVFNTDGTYTFTGSNTYSVGQNVNISGIVAKPKGGNSCFNVAKATVVASDVVSFTVSNSLTPGGASTLPTCADYVSTGNPSGGMATYIDNGYATTPTPPTDSVDFVRSTGTWASKESGINNVDLWMGGLAEIPRKQPLTPPMFGQTFQYVFEKQSLDLQNSDRFYYIARLMGQNLGVEIPAQKFTDIVRRNTPSVSSLTPTASTGILGMNSPGFGVSDCAWSPNLVSQLGVSVCSSGTMVPNNAPTTHVGLDNVTLFGNLASTVGVNLIGGAGDDSIQGTSGNDVLDGGISGGDLIYGYAGNDIIIGGAGEDLLNGGSGDDIINTGDNQAGDIADGGTGSDWIDCGGCTGFAISFAGETGNDFIQGGVNNDLLLNGGEGDDWLEGISGLDVMNGDEGVTTNFITGTPYLNGGNDVLMSGSGIGIEDGDGGDDIFLLGKGTDQPFGNYGFDWADYEYMVRHDVTATGLPNTFADLSGSFAPINTARNTDVLVEFEGVSGSTGDDVLLGGVLAGDTTIAAANNTTYGNTRSNLLTLPGSYNIAVGSQFSGAGIGPNAEATVVTISAGANPVTTVRLSTMNTAAVKGPILITTWPLTVPSLVTGLTDLVTGTPGWTKYSKIVPTATKWSGGGILLGGDGNDSIAPSNGEDIIHGSAYLHTCFTLRANPSKTPPPAMLSAMDVTCAGGRGFSNMTAAEPFMHVGAILPSDLRIVREILPTSTRVTQVETTQTTATYTAANTFHVGEVVTVNGLAAGATSLKTYDLTNAVVTAATATSFTVASSVGATTAPVTGITAGLAFATNTLDLSGGSVNTIGGPGGAGGVTVANGGMSGPATDFTFKALTKLPAGASLGCKITDAVSGNVITAYDMSMVLFDTGAAMPIQNCGSTTIPVAAPVIALANNAITATVGTAITPVKPTSTGGQVATFSISPALSAGLTFDTSTGTVAGTPTAAPAGTTNYTITATNASGTTTVKLKITIAALTKPTITVTTRTLTAVIGTPIASITPVNTGGAVTAYSIAPTLPDALVIDPVTGVISGTPAAAFAATVFTITATNTAGTSTATLTISAGTTAPTAPTTAPILTTSVAPQTVGSGLAITPVTITNTGGVATSFAILPTPLISGLVFDATTGTLSGTPVVRTNTTVTYRITATNAIGSNTLTYTLTVSGSESTTPVTPNNPVTPTSGNTGNQGATNFAITNVVPNTLSTASAVTLTTNGGTGAVTYTTDNNQVCKVSGRTLTASGPATCVVTATQMVAGAPVTSTATFTFSAEPQAALRITTRATTAKVGRTISLVTSGGSGSGAVTYALDPASSAACSLVVTKGGTDITASAAGSCTVIATKAASLIYAPVSSTPIVFTFN